MKKIPVVLVTAIVIIMIITAIVFGGYHYLITNEYILSARSVSPLGKRQQYVITSNLQTMDGDDGSIIPANTYYTFYPVGKESERGELVFDKLIGRKVGNASTVDVSQYLNQPVYIWGKFEYGLPIFISETTSPDLLNENVVLTITRVEFVDQN